MGGCISRPARPGRRAQRHNPFRSDFNPAPPADLGDYTSTSEEEEVEEEAAEISTIVDADGGIPATTTSI